MAFWPHDLLASVDLYEEGCSLGAAAAISEQEGRGCPINTRTARQLHPHMHIHGKREQEDGLYNPKGVIEQVVSEPLWTV